MKPKKQPAPKGPPLGLVQNTNAEYHGGPGISKSKLDAMLAGPRIYWNSYVNPDREPRKTTPALLLGSATHSAILEPDRFPIDFVVIPDYNLQTKAGRAERDLFLEECAAANVVPITADQHALACGMRDSVFAHPVAGPMLGDLRRAGAMAEQSYYAIDPATGLLVKCRFDYLLARSGIALDLKTTRGAKPRDFAKSCATYGYDRQEAHYRLTYERAIGQGISRWIFLAVESAPPFQVGLYTLPAQAVQAAQAVNADLLRQISDCTALDVWPDPAYAGVVELEMPGWHKREHEDSAENQFPEE